MFNLNEAQEQLSNEIHLNTVVVDAHSDRIMALMPEELYFDVSKEGPMPRKKLYEHLNDLKAGGIRCQVFPIWVSPHYNPISLRRALQMVDVFQRELKNQRARISLCTRFREIEEAVKKNKLAAILSMEGGEPLEGDVSMLRIFYQLGVRSLGFTQFPRNKLADGSGELRSNGGLTGHGHEVLEEMKRFNMLVDVSHINERGFWDVLNATNIPVIASHSNCKALCDHHRNLTDQQIRALADRKGVMGITFVESFLQKSADEVSLNNVLDHIDHIVKLVGVDYVGFGSDYMGMKKSKIKGLEDITKFPNITKGLLSRGYAREEIEKILGGNFLRVFKEILKD